MENLMKGSFGAEVKLLQQRLAEFGFYPGEINGQFNDETEKAVMEFQDSRGLAVDGLVGLITIHELDLMNVDLSSAGEGIRPENVIETSPPEKKYPAARKSEKTKKKQPVKKSAGGKKNA